MSSLLNVTNDPSVKILPAEHTRRSETPRSETVTPEDVQTEKPAFPWWTIIICGFMMLLYTGSPLDLIPDFIPVVGQMDDLLVDAGLLGIILRSVVRYYAVKKLASGDKKSLFKQMILGRLFRRARK
jgi:uncharacterized membrane protein YkvA (DUF1232 family)